MADPGRLIELLGLGEAPPAGDRRQVRAEEVLIERIRQGLPYACLEAIASRLSMGPTELGRVLRLSLRTLARRKSARQLSAGESDRLGRLTRIVALAEETLGHPTRTSRWLREPNAALGGTPPIDWLDTDLGARDVEALLLRAVHGVHS
jgi:putative toxin-antitoxin system antitoxin component (TIGR02293 family)